MPISKRESTVTWAREKSTYSPMKSSQSLDLYQGMKLVEKKKSFKSRFLPYLPFNSTSPSLRFRHISICIKHFYLAHGKNDHVSDTVAQPAMQKKNTLAIV
ncbi:hypothetical protein BDP67DRAFT_521337 [Colletotrichum lupini]|nr:hypothetical protein BDP67DRAFT_521337 [Colletotrichum lupini]